MEATFKETFLHSPLIGTFALKQKQTFEMIWTSSSFFFFLHYLHPNPRDNQGDQKNSFSDIFRNKYKYKTLCLF